MSAQVDPMNDFLQAIERERRAWDALQAPAPGMPEARQALYADWVCAVNTANLEAERFLQASRSRRAQAARPSNPGASAACPGSHLKVQSDSGTISMAPQGHSAAQTPQPLQ